jgi:ribosomal protein S18 acetylase RimI-like enzyme
MTYPNSTQVRLAALTEADFDVVSKLGATIWREYYSKIISMAQIEYMLPKRFSPDILHKYLNSSVRWFEILWLGDKPIGYCSYSLTSIPGVMKLEQIYLLKEFRRKGLGKFMLCNVESVAGKNELQNLTLQVNKHNQDALAVYHKAGYQIIAEALFDIGSGYFMDDFVMEKAL